VRESSCEITRLCESWWGKLADNTKADQHRFAEQLLALLGWQNPNGKQGMVTPFPAPADKPGPFPHFSYILRGTSQNSIAAHFVMPGTLEPPMLVTQRGLDFCDATRTLVQITADLNIDYAFVTDLHRSYFYDARAEELLLTANSPAEFRRDFVGVLTRSNVERGSLEEVRRQPRSFTARQLREWCQHWCEILTGDHKLSEEHAQLAIDRLLVLRYLLDHDILKRTGWRLCKRFEDLAAKCMRGDTRGVGRQFRALCHDIWFDWKATIYAHEPALDAVLEDDRVAGPLLREFALHSRNKFSIATILESFNYGDAAEKARVRMVPDLNEEREEYLARQTLAGIDDVRLEIDLADEGYRAIFYWFDRLVALYETLEVEFNTTAYAEPVAGDGEMDLFAWSEVASKRPESLSDKYQYAVEKGLILYYSAPRQLRTARLMLHLHLISRYHQSGQRFPRFPDMDRVFQSRPRVLDTDRKWIYQGRTAEDEWYM